jgi:CheY-like chemotaxis protein
MFEIKDSGIGMRKEDLPKLFHTFQRFESEKSHGIVGTGLGLSISKTFVEMMGGQIIVDSEYEQGSVFMVMIPLVLGNKEEAGVKKVSSEGRLYAPSAKILVVDDNEFNIRVAEGLFGLFKVNLHTAFSGKEAIDLVKNNDYDIVFMDHMMPGMDGVEATAEIRKIGGKFKNLPIMALTANAVQGAKEMFLANGFNGFISKPIDMQEMVLLLKEWLPKEKIEEGEKAPEDAGDKAGNEFLSALNKVNEINVEIGLSRVSGMEDMYQKTVELFSKKIISECDAMSAKLDDGDMKGFSILVHAIKSALATIGAMNLSETALRLETASKNDEADFCAQRFPPFKDKLISLHEDLLVIFPEAKEEAKKQKGDTAYLMENIEKALVAASDFDRDEGLKVVEDLLKYDFGEQKNDLLKKTADALNDFNFDSVTELLTEMKG